MVYKNIIHTSNRSNAWNNGFSSLQGALMHCIYNRISTTAAVQQFVSVLQSKHANKSAHPTITESVLAFRASQLPRPFCQDHICPKMHFLTISVPHLFWLWQKWVYQSIQRHTGLTHPFNFLTFGHSGSQFWVPECPNVKKLKKGGLD